ncbi:MAG: thioredoxin-disulfide reductase [Prolixibacteraceae bacterium]|nr:thioredoxin-disulfide reductase [Prolixibacteraceae bacterium]
MAEFHEVIIIGGGPAGLTAGIYLMRAGIDTFLLEKVIPGGTPVNTWNVENYPGFPEGISGRDLMERFTAHARNTGLVIKEFSEVEDISKNEGRFLVKTSEARYEAMGVIVAIGTEPAKMGIPGENGFLGRGISYCATCDGAFFRNLDVAVIGGGDAAIEESLSLANIAKRVYVIHRRDTLRAQKVIQERAFRNKKIEFLWNKKPLEIAGKDQVEYITVEDTKTGERTEVKIDGVFVYVGAKPNTSFLGNLVKRDETGFIVTDEALFTGTEGLYIAGDVRKKTLRQISTAVGDGALAAVNLEKYILQTK